MMLKRMMLKTMMLKTMRIALPIFVVFLLVQATGCAGVDSGITKAICHLQPTQGNRVTGTVTFTRQNDVVRGEAMVHGLKPGNHGFHIHQFGDISAADGKSTGGHFNPDGHDHAGPMEGKRHVGDLGNLEADASGHAMYKRVDKYVQIHGQHSILSRGITIHAGTDDLKSQPTGAAGGRVACGVIESSE